MHSQRVVHKVIVKNVTFYSNYGIKKNIQYCMHSQRVVHKVIVKNVTFYSNYGIKKNIQTTGKFMISRQLLMVGVSS